MKNLLKMAFILLVALLSLTCKKDDNGPVGTNPIESSASQLYWQSQNPSPTGNTLYGVFFIDANTGTAVGSSGTILRTTNGGASWTRQSSEMEWSIHSVSFTDANTGTAVGDLGTILRTTNGGASWKNQSSEMSGVFSIASPSPMQTQERRWEIWHNCSHH